MSSNENIEAVEDESPEPLPSGDAEDTEEVGVTEVEDEYEGQETIADEDEEGQVEGDAKEEISDEIKDVKVVLSVDLMVKDVQETAKPEKGKAKKEKSKKPKGKGKGKGKKRASEEIPGEDDEAVNATETGQGEAVSATETGQEPTQEGTIVEEPTPKPPKKKAPKEKPKPAEAEKKPPNKGGKEKPAGKKGKKKTEARTSGEIGTGEKGEEDAKETEKDGVKASTSTLKGETDKSKKRQSKLKHPSSQMKDRLIKDAASQDSVSSGSSSEESISDKFPKSKIKLKTKGKGTKRASLAKSSIQSLSLNEEEKEPQQRSVTFTESDLIAKEKKQKKSKAPKEKGEKKGKGKKKGEEKKVEKKTDTQLEAELLHEIEEERMRFLEEKRQAIAKEKQERMEGAARSEHLDLTYSFITRCLVADKVLTDRQQADEEWRQYLDCDGLPAPWDVAGMNTYIHLWEKEITTVTADQCRKRTAEAINLLGQLEDIIDDPFDTTPSKNNDWKWVAEEFRQHQATNLEFCTYRLLRDIKTKMNRITIPTADYRISHDLFAMCLYVTVTLPTPVYNVRTASRARIQLNWPEMHADVVFPPSLKCDFLAIRGLYTKYDHYTDKCKTYRCPNIHPYYSKNLKTACHEELIRKARYKYDNKAPVTREPVEVVQEDGTVVLVEAQPEPELGPDELAPMVPYQALDPNASDLNLAIIEDEMKAAAHLLQFDLPPNVLNLRKYTVLGGIYSLDLFYQPPQPQGMVSFEVFVSTLIEPCQLVSAPFEVEYIPPVPPEPGARRSPEEIEEEMLQQEKVLDELILLTVVLPKHVYWLDVPIVTRWDKKNNQWTTDGIFDFKNIEERGYVSFRTGSFLTFGIATLRWTNLPFQAWEIRPEKNGTVTFQLTCAILTIEFHIQKNTICVKDVQCAPNNAFDKHIGVYYKFKKLVYIMKSIGIDVFPFHDTFWYVEGTCEKFWPMEKHLYFCMALISVVYNMTWSRWNMTLDNRSIAFQMRAYRFERPKQANFDTVLVQPARTVYIDCTEVSPEFNPTPVEGMKFYVDLWHLIRLTSRKAIKKQITGANQPMLHTLYKFYRNIRFLSFS